MKMWEIIKKTIYDFAFRNCTALESFYLPDTLCTIGKYAFSQCSSIKQLELPNSIKSIEENDTVGIIICKQDNEYVIKYCSDDRIIAREYELV